MLATPYSDELRWRSCLLLAVPYSDEFSKERSQYENVIPMSSQKKEATMRMLYLSALSSFRYGCSQMKNTNYSACHEDSQCKIYSSETFSAEAFPVLSANTGTVKSVAKSRLTERFSTFEHIFFLRGNYPVGQFSSSQFYVV